MSGLAHSNCVPSLLEIALAILSVKCKRMYVHTKNAIKRPTYTYTSTSVGVGSRE